jgi:hypothetical protein
MLWVLFALILFFHMALEALDIRKAFLAEGKRLLSPIALNRFRLWNSKFYTSTSYQMFEDSPIERGRLASDS